MSDLQHAARTAVSAPGPVFVTAVNGTPVILQLGFDPFDPQGDWILPLTISNDPALSGPTFTLTGFGFNIDGIVGMTNNADVSTL